MDTIRPARMAAKFVAPGDVIVTGPGEQPEIETVGTVVTAQTVKGVRHLTVRAPSGSTWPMRKAADRPLWIHVPTTT